MNKNKFLICGSLIMLMALVSGCKGQRVDVIDKESMVVTDKENVSVIDKENKSTEATEIENSSEENNTEKACSWLTYADRKNFEVSLSAEGEMYDGIEVWEKGKEIIFNMESEVELNLQVGLMQIIDENTFEFGSIISEEVQITEGKGEVHITVPETRKYAIYIKNTGNVDIEFNLNLNVPLTKTLI